ncbi:MAG: hypothetical protein ABGZ23_25625, partial [Fuerstiella sp.]
ADSRQPNLSVWRDSSPRHFCLYEFLDMSADFIALALVALSKSERTLLAVAVAVVNPVSVLRFMYARHLIVPLKFKRNSCNVHLIPFPMRMFRLETSAQGTLGTSIYRIRLT